MKTMQGIRKVKTKTDLEGINPETEVLIGSDKYPSVIISKSKDGFEAVGKINPDRLVVFHYRYIKRHWEESVIIGYLEREIEKDSEEYVRYMNKLEQLGK